MITRLARNGPLGIVVSQWHAAETIRAAQWVDSHGWTYVLSRNMDGTRHPWRVSTIDPSGEPVGHSYGSTATDATRAVSSVARLVEWA